MKKRQLMNTILKARTRWYFPFNLTLSVTNSCNSRCKTCFLWKNKSAVKELDTYEYLTLFEQLKDKLYWVTISGGEPFLRKDLSDIVTLLCGVTNVNIVNIPTNCLLPKQIQTTMRDILEFNHNTEFILNLSLDSPSDEHDKIRGVKGNFKKFGETYLRVVSLQTEFKNLRIGVHTVVSRYNIDDVLDDRNVIDGWKVDDIIYEIAENRVELHNENRLLVTDSDKFRTVFEKLSKLESSSKMDFLGGVVKEFRKIYYKNVVDFFEGKQRLKCYAGRASIQIMPNGDVVPCCIKCNVVGNIRESNFEKIIKGKEMKKAIRETRNCSCPLANAFYTNYICNFGVLRRE